MLLVGLEDCATCKIVKKVLPNLPYLELPKNPVGPSEPEVRKIKMALGKLNTGNHFPVIINDDRTKVIVTDILLDNMNVEKLQQLLET